MKDELIEMLSWLFFWICGLWSGIFLVTMLLGCINGYRERKPDNQCNVKNTRIGVVFPGFRAGCWLSEPVGGMEK
jgi:hypothetical protein